MEFILIIIGFILLIKAADYFVDASTTIAKIFKVSEIVIGATIVSIGTTLPETMVSATSAFKGHGDIAYGNALGSIICNTALISALSLVFSPGKVESKTLKIPVIFFFLSFAMYAIFAFIFGGFSRIAGFILFSIFILYVIAIIRNNKLKNSEQIEKIPEQVEKNIDDVLEGRNVKDNKTNDIIKSIMTIIISAIVIAFASNLLVDNGTAIARKFHIPESVIGITMIALGTSLPELSTAITSLVKGHSNLSIGNIIGANFFNVVVVSAIAAIVGPFKIPTSKMIGNVNASFIIDLPVASIVMVILCIPSIMNGRTKRWQGILLLTIYALFLIYQFKS
ncbi:MAG: calcium/sodium antiporter [Lachnospiraceae bacterium]|nr:calcium/sodium antiporter [Lachnospiraceae bacterium]